MTRGPHARASRLAWLVALALALGCGLLLRAPYLDAGSIDDDFVQRAMLRGEFPLQRSPLDLYWFGGRDAQEARALVDDGYHPWWAHPQHKVAMLRPLSSALLAAGHALGLTAWGEHAVSLACWALTVIAACLLLVQLLPARVAAIALLLYALDEAHGSPTGWIANRSTLVSTALGFFALALHVQFRRDGRTRDRMASLALLALALLGGEYGFASLGYVVAYELLAAPRDGTRLRAVAPWLGLGALHLASAALLGFGISFSGFYVSPLQAPLEFVQMAVLRVPALVLDVMWGVPARFVESGLPLRDWVLERDVIDARGWHALPPWRHGAVVLGALTVAGVAAVLRRAMSTRPELRGLSALALGALLSLVPSAGALPGSRLACAAALGAAALIATLLDLAVAAVRDGTRAWGTRGVAALAALAIVAVHGVLAAERARTDAESFAVSARAARRWALQAELPSTGLERTDVWLLSASDFTTAAHVPWVRRAYGLPVPRSFRLLSGAGMPHDVLRIDARTIEIQTLGSSASGGFVGSLYRPEGAPFAVGDRVVLPRLEVEVMAVANGNPWRFRVRADRSLDDPSVVMLCAEPRGLVRCAPPPVGSLMRVPRAPEPWGDPEASFSRSVRKW